MQGKVDSRAMREVNRSIVLDMIRRGGRISRTDLARRSALTKPTVSAIVEELIATGVVHEVGFGESVPTGGRRARLLEFNDSSAAYLGIRFGVHITTVVVSDARGVIRASTEAPTPHHDAEAAIAVALSLIAPTLERASIPRKRVQGVGVALAGLVDCHSGVCVLAPNLGWRDVPLRDLLQGKLNLPVVVNNVTDAAALAEGRLGNAQGARTYCWIYAGSGIGAGVVIDGQLFYGARGFSGEIGHCRLGKDGPILEQVASATVLRENAQRALDAGEQSALTTLGSQFSPGDVLRLGKAGDPLCARLVAEAGARLGVGVSYLLNILNPELVVLGGPLAEGGEVFLEAVRASVAAHVLAPENVQLLLTELGDGAPEAGAVLAAMDNAVQSLRIVAAAPY